MKPKIKIIYSKYYLDEITGLMVNISKKILTKAEIDYDSIGVPGSFEIPFEIARSIKEDTVDKNSAKSFEGENKEKIRDNILQMAKLSQLNLNNQPLYDGYLALGCIIKGKTINHQAISTSIFTNLQRISIENIMPIGNGIFNANNMAEAKDKFASCTEHAVTTLTMLLIDEKHKTTEQDEKKK